MQSLLGIPGFTDDYFPERLGEELLDRTPQERMIFNNENPVYNRYGRSFLAGSLLASQCP